MENHMKDVFAESVKSGKMQSSVKAPIKYVNYVKELKHGGKTELISMYFSPEVVKAAGWEKGMKLKVYTDGVNFNIGQAAEGFALGEMAKSKVARIHFRAPASIVFKKGTEFVKDYVIDAQVLKFSLAPIKVQIPE